MGMNANTGEVLLHLIKTSQKYLRAKACDVQAGERTPVTACAWEPLGGGIEYFGEGVDPNEHANATPLVVGKDLDGGPAGHY
jgi:hypothetical protein